MRGARTAAVKGIGADRQYVRGYIEIFFLATAIIFYGRVWIWPIDVEQQVELYKPFGYVLRFALVLIVPYSARAFRDAGAVAATFPISIVSALIVLCFYSIIWSTSVFTSVQNALDMLCLFLVAVVVSSRLNAVCIVKVIFYTALFIVFVSVVLSVAGVDFAVMGGGHLGQWRGLFGHKNNYAEFVVFTSIVILFLGAEAGVRRSHRVAFFVLSAISLAKAQSSTCIALYIANIGVWVLWPVIRKASKRRLLSFVVALGLVVAAIFAVLFVLAPAVEALGRDLTFTGRTQIWTYYWDVSMKSPWVGYGYGAFFTDESIVMEARSVLFSTIRSPHNGYLATALSIGWPGLLIYATWHISILWKSYSNQFGRLSGAILSLALNYAIFSMFEVAGAMMISIGLLLILVLVCSAIRASSDRRETRIDKMMLCKQELRASI